jgi:hypothetical protein
VGGGSSRLDESGDSAEARAGGPQGPGDGRAPKAGGLVGIKKEEVCLRVVPDSEDKRAGATI